MPETRAARGRVPKPDQRPEAPWGKAPLAELAILAGIICLAIGVIGTHYTLIGVGVALAGLGGMEVAIREHFAGYRSHTLVLAAFPTVVITVLTVVAGVPKLIIPPLAVFVFVAAFAALRRAWDRSPV
jgi:uncharacterized integral membrane protein